MRWQKHGRWGCLERCLTFLFDIFLLIYVLHTQALPVPHSLVKVPQREHWWLPPARQNTTLRSNPEQQAERSLPSPHCNSTQVSDKCLDWKVKSLWGSYNSSTISEAVGEIDRFDTLCLRRRNWSWWLSDFVKEKLLWLLVTAQCCRKAEVTLAWIPERQKWRPSSFRNWIPQPRCWVFSF